MTPEQYEKLPQKVKDVLDTYVEEGDLYEMSSKVIKRLNKIGWDADMDLAGELVDIRRKKKKKPSPKVVRRKAVKKTTLNVNSAISSLINGVVMVAVNVKNTRQSYHYAVKENDYDNKGNVTGNYVPLGNSNAIWQLGQSGVKNYKNADLAIMGYTRSDYNKVKGILEKAAKKLI